MSDPQYYGTFSRSSWLIEFSICKSNRQLVSQRSDRRSQADPIYAIAAGRPERGPRELRAFHPCRAPPPWRDIVSDPLRPARKTNHHRESHPRHSSTYIYPQIREAASPHRAFPNDSEYPVSEREVKKIPRDLLRRKRWLLVGSKCI